VGNGKKDQKLALVSLLQESNERRPKNSKKDRKIALLSLPEGDNGKERKIAI